jgi:sulfide dehydrogenase [flavocytochrome c] flavoprotein chain
MTLSRRAFFSSLLASGAVLSMPYVARAQSAGRIVVIGGGFGGASAASALKALDSRLSVTLVEPAREFVTCPYSNLVLGGMRDMRSITHGYAGLQRRGVEVVHDSAAAIDTNARSVRLAGGQTLAYDKLVVSPGIDIRFPGRPGRRRCCCAVSWKRCRTAGSSSWRRRRTRSVARPALTSASA